MKPKTIYLSKKNEKTLHATSTGGPVLLGRMVPMRMNGVMWNEFGSTVEDLKRIGLFDKGASRTSVIRDLVAGWIIETRALIARQQASNLIYNHAVDDFEGGSKR